MNKVQLMVLWLVLMCILLNGCAALTLPGKLIGGTLKIIGNIAGAVFDLIKRAPKPPPGVF